MPRFKQYDLNDKIAVDNFNTMSAYMDAFASMSVDGGTLLVNQSGAALDVTTGPQARVCLVRLAEKLDVGVLNTPTTAKANAYAITQRNDETPDTVALNTDVDLTIINRNPGFSAELGDDILVVRVNYGSTLEWSPLTGNNQTSTQIIESGTGDCSCEHCIKGNYLTGAQECCYSFLMWTTNNPWSEASVIGLQLTYSPNDTWVSQPFYGPTSNGVRNEYCFVLTAKVTGTSTFKLSLVKDNGADPVCLEYACDSFRCQCDNILTLKKPWGKFYGINRTKLACNVCLKLVKLGPRLLPPIPAPCFTLEDKSVNWPGGMYLTVEGASGYHICDIGFSSSWSIATYDTPTPNTCSSGNYPYHIDINGTHLGTPSGGSTFWSVPCIPASTQSCSISYVVYGDTSVPDYWAIGSECVSSGTAVTRPVGRVQILNMAVLWTGPDEVSVVVNYILSTHSFFPNGNVGSGDLTPRSWQYTKVLGTLAPSTATQQDWENLFSRSIDLELCVERGCTPTSGSIVPPASVTISSASIPVGGGGSYSPTNTGSCNDVCVPPKTFSNTDGFCCYNGLCLTYVDQGFCDALGTGAVWTDSGTCENNSCEQILSTCCLGGGGCMTHITAAQCTALDGIAGSTDDCSTAC